MDAATATAARLCGGAEDKADGDIKITMVGSNEAGFEMAFAKDAETVINAEFKAQPMDETGTLITYKETIKG